MAIYFNLEFENSVYFLLELGNRIYFLRELGKYTLWRALFGSI